MNRIQECSQIAAGSVDYFCDGYPLRVFERADLGLVQTDNFEVAGNGHFRMTQMPCGEIWAECAE